MEIRWPGRWAGFALALALAACGGKNKGAEKPDALASGEQPPSMAVPTVDPSLCDTAGKKVVTSDLNKDGKPDVWKLYATIEQDGTTTDVLTCKQVDFDHDGRKDYVATYLKTGEKIAEEFDFGFDGKFDAREHFDKKSAMPVIVERDTDHDKKPDMWEKYRDGVLESVHRDRNGDGKPDMWETYDANGVITSILFDDDFDGRVDRKEAPRKPAPKVPDLPAATKGPVDENPVEPEPAPAPPPPPAKPAPKKK
jgi:hypothetical protein